MDRMRRLFDGERKVRWYQRKPRVEAGHPQIEGWDEVEEPLGEPRTVSRFAQIVEEMVALHDKKGRDYDAGTLGSYANIRASEEFGVEPWISALIRLNDKITRLKSFIQQGRLANESALDSIRDVAVYAVIVEILYREKYENSGEKIDSSRTKSKMA